MMLKEVMTRGVAEISPQATLKQAAEQMRSLDIGALPVCSENRFVGMLTDRDIAVRSVAAGRDPNATTVSDVMTPNVAWCFDDEEVSKAAQIMEEKQIRRLLVFDHNDNVVGIVSIGDLARHTHDRNLCGEVLERVCEPS